MDISEFLSVGANKKRLFELVLLSVIDRWEKFGGRIIYLSSVKKCTREASTIGTLLLYIMIFRLFLIVINFCPVTAL